jgi:hypothetical protein
VKEQLSTETMYTTLSKERLHPEEERSDQGKVHHAQGQEGIDEGSGLNHRGDWQDRTKEGTDYRQLHPDHSRLDQTVRYMSVSNDDLGKKVAILIHFEKEQAEWKSIAHQALGSCNGWKQSFERMK